MVPRTSQLGPWTPFRTPVFGCLQAWGIRLQSKGKCNFKGLGSLPSKSPTSKETVGRRVLGQLPKAALNLYIEYAGAGGAGVP